MTDPGLALIEAYLNHLRVELGTLTPGCAPVLAEAEARLRDPVQQLIAVGVELETAQRQAIARSGSPEMVAAALG